MNKIHRVVLTALCLLGCSAISAAAQAPGYANIENPQRSDVLSGVVTISGSASHPSFEAYELSFALDPNESGTWFPIGEHLNTPVEQGNLGLWDTTGLSDGFYQVRLQVVLDNGTVLESAVENLQIRNYTGSVLSTLPAGTLVPPAATTTSPATATTVVFQTSADPPSPTTSVFNAFLIGGAAGGIGLLGLALFLVLRKDVRYRRHQTKMRRLLRRSSGDEIT